jgi:ADP-ribose pyrophosphatase YjhB (NUDIX family)
MEDHLITKITQKAIIAIGDKILLTKNADYSLWEIPGGRIHVGESPEEGLEREILEEIGLRIKVGKPFKTAVSTTPKGNIVFMVFYLCQLADDLENIKLQEEEVSDYQLVSKGDWAQLSIYPVIKPILENYFSKTIQ